MALSDAKVQVVLVGVIALCCPGLFNSLNGLGAAGGSTPKYANQANASLYAFFAVFGYFGGVFFSVFGNRILLCGGGLTYALYALGMYLASNYHKAEWMAVFVGCVLGIGAGLFWTAQGAMMMAYSTPDNRGHYISLFWIIFNVGGVLGGILQMAVNWKVEGGQANSASYFTFIALMAVGSLSVPFIIVAPNKVKRSDGGMVVFNINGDWKTEVAGAVKASLNPYMMLLSVFFLSSNWFYTYQFNFVNGTIFNIRTRGFNSAMYWAAQMLAAFLLGELLDNRAWTRRQQAVVGWTFAFVSFLVAWSMGTWVQWGFEGGHDKGTLSDTKDLVDIGQAGRCAYPSIVYCIYGFADAALQAYAYWLMAAIAGRNTVMSARFAGFYKGIQSAGAAVAWGLDLRDNILYRHQYWIGFSAWAFGSLLAYFVARDVKNLEEVEMPPALQKSISVLNNTGEGIVQRNSSVKESSVAQRLSLEGDAEKRAI